MPTLTDASLVLTTLLLLLLLLLLLASLPTVPSGCELPLSVFHDRVAAASNSRWCSSAATPCSKPLSVPLMLNGSTAEQLENYRCVMIGEENVTQQNNMVSNEGIKIIYKKQILTAYPYTLLYELR